MTSKKIFNSISYLRFLFYIWSIYFLVESFNAINNGHNGWEQLNNLLVTSGIGLTFSSLKDPTRRKNFIFNKVWSHKTLGTLIIIFISFLALGLILLGLSTLFFSQTNRSETIAIGMVVLGIGMIGYIKYLVERLENNS